MEKIGFEGFFAKKRMLFLGFLILIVLAAGSVFGVRYYNYNRNENAGKLLWKGVRLYMSYNGKNPKVLVRSALCLKKLQTGYKGTGASKISLFYLGSDYMKSGKPDEAAVYFGEYIKNYPKPDSDNLTFLAYSNLAAAAMVKKDYKRAIADFKAMSKIDGIELQEYALLEEAALYSQIKKPRKAAAIYKAMLTNDAMTKDRGYIENLIQLNS